MGTIFKKIAIGIDVTEMNAALYHEHEIWNQIKARQETPGSPHSETKTIFLRWARDRSPEAAFTQIEAVNYPALANFPEAEDLIAKFFSLVPVLELGRVIIVSLKPGGKIAEHFDDGEYADHYQRFHLVLDSKDGNIFYGHHSDDHKEAVHMKTGELWWFDNKKPHEVENTSDAPRVHLIFDAVAPAYLRDYDLKAPGLRPHVVSNFKAEWTEYKPTSQTCYALAAADELPGQWKRRGSSMAIRRANHGN